MVDPSNITNFTRDEASLQEVLLFWICAANKSALSACRGLERLLRCLDPERIRTPFAALKEAEPESLPLLMKKSGIGQYNQKARSFLALVHSGIDLSTCTIDDLEAIPGIGMKTSRCFLLHTRKNARVAGLDRHIRSFLRRMGHPVPEGTLNSKQYLAFEKIFLEEADRRKMSPAELDLEVWLEFTRSFP
jgi:thermostable 8-oxoguanine DNA glycosylase